MEKPSISERGLQMPLSPIRKLVPLADAAKSRGTKVYHLNIGQPDLPTPDVAIKALKNIDRTVLEYSPSEGLLSYRKKLVQYYASFDAKISTNDILVTTGGSEALLLTFFACLNPKDEIITPEPTYANYLSFASMADIKIKGVPSSIDNGFALPPISEFEKQITERTKAIMICNPSNPTGYLYTREEMEQIKELVKKHNLYLISDEVYREFIYTDTPYFSALNLQDIEQNVILIDSVSKRYSECGVRIGSIITKNEELRATLMKYCQARLSPPLLGQIVAEASIDAPVEYNQAIYNEYLERREFMINRLNTIEGVYSPMPMGAFYTVVRLPVEDAEDFAAWCLSEFEYKGETVFVAPAAGFYSNPKLGKNQVRMAYVLNRKDLEAAMIVLEKALEKYKSLKQE